MLEVSTLTAEELSLLDEASVLFERSDDGLVWLNEFGVFLLERVAPATLRTKVTVDRGVLSGFGRVDQTEALLDGIRDLLEQLRAPEQHRATLHHETSFRGVSDPQCALFKGASGRAGVFRACYRYDAEPDRLDVFYVWLDHASYVREAANELTRAMRNAPMEDISTQVHALDRA